jgi:type IV secretory pathway protease TraF
MTWKPAVLTGLCLAVVSLGLSVQQWAPCVVAYGPSTSLPKGWYVRALGSRPLQLGDIVVVSAPDVMQPYVPTEVRGMRLLKQVAALPGMQVCWGMTTMIVVRPVEWYPFVPDAPAIRQPPGCRILGDKEIVLVGTHPRSFDSRYVGPISTQLIQWRAVPVWTWKGDEGGEGGTPTRGL